MTLRLILRALSSTTVRRPFSTLLTRPRPHIALAIARPTPPPVKGGAASQPPGAG